MLGIPEKAIECFEKQTNTRLTCYIHSPLFSMALKYRIHDFTVCGKAKKTNEKSCIQFDFLDASRNAWNYREGGIKICHAGVLEWFTPVMNDHKLICFLTAGVRRPPDHIPGGFAVLKAGTSCRKTDLSGVAETNPEELRQVMELLRMLAARLALWHIEILNSDFSESEMSRADVIRCLIGRGCTRGLTLQELAAHLHLSPSRTAHLVKEETGESFTGLLLRNRIGFAANLLRNTEIPVSRIAERCGFGDTANFHRIFRREFHQTPLEFRKSRNR